MASRSRAALTLVLLLTGCGLLAGCESPVAPERWADSVCVSVRTWQVKVGQLTKNAQDSMATAKSPHEAQQSLLGLLGGAESASETARITVSGAGVPDVDKGSQFSDQLLKAIAAARDAYGKARRTIEGLPTDVDKPFYDGVTTAMETLKQEYQPDSADPAKLDSAELKKAFTTAKNCQSTS
ncbi:hypothetical protein AB0M43_15585 [Longispora sp. NPDC051575]|uniref:hypothetical protein n=1 Tax=Longispora sp. NPDC051575 TaxID=3154943 RepID=UPI00341B9560